MGNSLLGKAKTYLSWERTKTMAFTAIKNLVPAGVKQLKYSAYRLGLIKISKSAKEVLPSMAPEKLLDYGMWSLTDKAIVDGLLAAVGIGAIGLTRSVGALALELVPK